MPKKAVEGVLVRVRVPEYLHQWVSDCADRDYRSVEQQVVFLLARAFEGFEPEIQMPEEKDDVPATPVPAAVAGTPRYPVLLEPPQGTMTDIVILGGFSDFANPSLSLQGKGSVMRIDADMWSERVEKSLAEYTGRKGFTLLGEHGGWLYLK